MISRSVARFLRLPLASGVFAVVWCAAPAADTAALTVREHSLEECLAQAQQNNRRRPASQFAVAAAEAQHRQVLSAYWPQVDLKAGFTRNDEAPNFIFPASVMGIPGQSVTTPPSTAFVTVPAGVFGPTAVQLPVSVPAQTITTQPQLFPVPAQDVKLIDRDSTTAVLSAKWLLFDGGMRRGLATQAQAYIDLMKQEARRTDLEIADSVHRYYYGAVLARQIVQLGRDTLARMEATLNLTESLYQGGSGRVTKADYLDNKIMVESVRALVATLEKNEAMAQAALANTMGLSWKDSVAPRDREIPLLAFDQQLDDLVGDAYRFSPDWARFEAGVRASEGAVRTARSEYAPKVGLTGSLRRWENSYDAGLSTPTNRAGWALGLGFELPVFDGLRTRAKVAEVKAKLAELQEKGILLREGIGLQVRDTFLGLAAANKSATATRAAMQAAVENRDLNTRAYQQELVDTEKVIRAQLMEAMMTAQHLKARYDLVALQSQLSLIVGHEITRQLAASP